MRPRHARLLPLLLALLTPLAMAAPGDADDADSLRFGDFHQDKEGAITVWDSDKGEPGGFREKNTQVTYDAVGQPAAATPAPRTGAAVPAGTRPATAATPDALSKGKGYNGQRFMIRARYTPGSTSGPTAAAASNDLHRQMAAHCPDGWLLVREWGVPVERDFHLHYLFQCASEEQPE